MSLHHPTIRAITPLPEYWQFGRRFRGFRITTLPAWYQQKAIAWPDLPPLYRAALRAAEGFDTLRRDQAEGR